MKTEERGTLKNHVIDYLCKHLKENKNYPEYTVIKRLNEILQHGCQSGTVSHLVYYTDTVKFYNRYRLEIEALLIELEDGTGESRINLLKKHLDTADWYDQDEARKKNFLAWFGFEETCSQILADLEESEDLEEA